jgi:hypothetical protein
MEGDMAPGERLDRIENIIEKQMMEIGKVNEAARTLIIVGRTCLDSIGGLHGSIGGLQDSSGELQVSIGDLGSWIQQMGERHDADYKKLLDAQAATDKKLNTLIDTVDRIIRHRNGKQ